MKRVLLLPLFLPLLSFGANVQVATLIAAAQNVVVREVLAEVITPDHQVVAAETSGVVRSSRLEMGTHVEKGEVVVEIESSEQQAILDIAVKQLSSAEVEKMHSQRNLQRAKINRDQRAISEAQFDEVETAFARSRAQLALMQSRVRLEETRLRKYNIRSPFAGELVRASPVVGQYVKPGDPLFEIVNTEKRRIAVQLTPAETSALLNSRYALFCANEMLTLISVSPSGDMDTGMTSIELEGCSAGLRPGQRVGLDLVNVNVADVPGKSIQSDAKGEYVYVVRGGIVVRRALEALDHGENVIVMGADRVDVGDLVNPIALDDEGRNP